MKAHGVRKPEGKTGEQKQLGTRGGITNTFFDSIASCSMLAYFWQNVFNVQSAPREQKVFSGLATDLEVIFSGWSRCFQAGTW